MRLEEAFRRTVLGEVVEYELFRELCPTAHVALKRSGERVFDRGAVARSFTFLVTGRVKLVQVRCDGRESILDFVDVGGTICPAKPHREDARFCCDAVCTAAATRILVVRRTEALELSRREPAVTELLLDLVEERTARMCARIGELMAGKVQCRIAALLSRLAELGTLADGHVRIELPLSRRELAAMTGTTVESAIRAMKKLERAGMIETHPWGFAVLDREALRRAAESPS